jgi:hypothetical protein
MSCIENKKKFLWMTWLGDHKWKIIRFGQFMSGSNAFSASVQCENCGMCTYTILDEEDLLKFGKTVEEIKEGRSRDFYFTE